MTKQEAIKAMEKGDKVRHRYFSDEEWITINDGKIQTEEGYFFPPYEFWKYRETKCFEQDWEVIEHELFCCCVQPKQTLYPDHKYRCTQCGLVWYN